MKRLIIFSILALTTLFVFAQQVTDTIPIVHTTGQSIGTFLKNNGWHLALVVVLLFSEWMGTTGKVKEGSIWAWIINLVEKIIRGKSEIIKTKKAKFMNDDQIKKAKGLTMIIMIFILSGIGLASAQDTGLLSKLSAQDFKSKDNIKTLYGDSILSSIKKWDLATGVNAMSINLKTGELGAFNSAGFGIVYSGYKLKSDGLTVYKTFSAGGMLLFGDTDQNSLLDLSAGDSSAEPPKTDFGIMGVVGVGPVSMGPTYFIVSETLLLNLQLTFTF